MLSGHSGSHLYFLPLYPRPGEKELSPAGMFAQQMKYINLDITFFFFFITSFYLSAEFLVQLMLTV